MPPVGVCVCRQAVKLLRQCKFQQEPNYNQLANAFRDIQTVRKATAAASVYEAAQVLG